MGAITMPVREKLDNLIFVINCNLQRLDGPVRGNGKIIQELEAAYQGAGWNVIKVIWGYRWDPLLARDDKGLLRKTMEECVDGEYQNFKAKGGAYTREHFFGRYPELKAMVANMSDEDIWHLNRGGHDAVKVYAAYHAAVNHKGRPTVILAKTVKGYGMGEAGEAQNITHQKKKLDDDDLKQFRDRFRLPVTDEQIREPRVLQARRRQRGDEIPQDAAREARRLLSEAPHARRAAATFPSSISSRASSRRAATASSRPRWRSSGFLTALVRDKGIGPRIVPIVPDEARTFGMEGLFRQVGIYSSLGPALHAARLRPAHVLPRGQEGPDPRGRHQRGRLVLLVDRVGHVVLDARRADDSFLYLLLDVRLPAGRRLRVGRRRQPLARLPDRRHFGPYDARGRGPAAPGRPQPARSRRRSRTAARTTRATRTSSR